MYLPKELRAAEPAWHDDPARALELAVAARNAPNGTFIFNVSDPFQGMSGAEDMTDVQKRKFLLKSWDAPPCPKLAAKSLMLEVHGLSDETGGEEGAKKIVRRREKRRSGAEQAEKEEDPEPTSAVDRARAGARLPSDNLASRLVAAAGDDGGSSSGDSGASEEGTGARGGDVDAGGGVDGGSGSGWLLAGPDVETV